MIPLSFVAGDTVTWSYSSAAYSSLDGYAAEYVFVSPAGQKTTIGVGNVAGGWDFTITAAESAGWVPGDYTWQLYVKLGAERYTVDRGALIVLQNLENQTVGADTRNYWTRLIAAIDEVMLGRIPADVNQYTILGRSLTKLTLAELRQERGYAEQQLNKYLQKTGQGGRSRIIRTVI